MVNVTKLILKRKTIELMIVPVSEPIDIAMRLLKDAHKKESKVKSDFTLPRGKEMVLQAEDKG